MTRQKTKGWLLACACVLLIAASVVAGMPAGAQDNEPPERTPVPTATPTILPTATSLVTPTSTPTQTGAPVRTGTPTVTATRTEPPKPQATTPLPIPPPVTTIAPPTTTIPPSQTPSPAPTHTPMPTLTPTPTIAPTLPEQALRIASDNWIPLAVGVVAVFILFVIVVFFAIRGGGKKAPTVIVRAFLISEESPTLHLPIAKESVTLGRAKDCDVQITDKMKLSNVDTISRHHARLEKRGERWVLIDGVAPGQPSANGVFVNDKRTRENFLIEGDVVRLGLVAFQFVTQLPQPNSAQGGAR